MKPAGSWSWKRSTRPFSLKPLKRITGTLALRRRDSRYVSSSSITRTLPELRQSGAGSY
jgi:hypothetical protein